MATIANITKPSDAPVERSERVSFRRLLWVAPLTVAVALAVNFAIRLLVQALDPSAARMGQLGPPLLLLTAEGAVCAVVVFALMGLALRRPIFWFRVIGVVVLLISILPDLALGVGGSTALLGMRAMGPFLSLGMPGPGGGPPPGGPRGGAPSGGPPAGFVMPAMAPEQVAILLLLHTVTAAVCIVLLTTLARQPDSADRAAVAA